MEKNFNPAPKDIGRGVIVFPGTPNAKVGKLVEYGFKGADPTPRRPNGDLAEIETDETFSQGKLCYFYNTIEWLD
jgi:hypothetical protein